MGTGNTAGSDARYRGLGNPFERAKKRIAMYFCNALFGLMLFGFQNHFSSLSSAASVYCLFAGFSFLNLFIVVRIGTVDRGRRSICESRLFDCGIRQALQNLPDICMDADGLPLNFLRTNRLPLVDASVGGVRVLGCHLPKGVLDDDRGVIANAKFQKEDFPACTGTEKILIPLCCSVPAIVLHEGMRITFRFRAFYRDHVDKLIGLIANFR